MQNPIVLILVGLVVGVYSGLMGLGGGTLMIPIMVLLLGFKQIEASMTSLAVMTLPVFLYTVIQGYKEGDVKPVIAFWIAIGVALGTYSGYRLAKTLEDRQLKLVFGFVLVYVAGYTIFQTLGKQQLVRSILMAAVLTVVAAGLYWGTRYFDRMAAATSHASVASRP